MWAGLKRQLKCRRGGGDACAGRHRRWGPGGLGGPPLRLDRVRGVHRRRGLGFVGPGTRPRSRPSPFGVRVKSLKEKKKKKRKKTKGDVTGAEAPPTPRFQFHKSIWISGSLSGSQQHGRSTRYSPLIPTRRLRAIDSHQHVCNPDRGLCALPRSPQGPQSDVRRKASNHVKHRWPSGSRSLAWVPA